MTNRVVFSVVDLENNGDWLATFRFRKGFTVESTRCLGYFNLENTDFRRSHSSVKLDHDEDRRYARSSIVVNSCACTYYQHDCGNVEADHCLLASRTL